MNMIWKVIIIPVIIVLVLFFAYIYIRETTKSIRFEKRITDFALLSTNDSEMSLFARISLGLEKIIKFISNFLKRHKIFLNKAAKYEKYIYYKNKFAAIDYISIKILSALFLTSLNIITSFNAFNWFRLITYLITFIIGYYLPNIYLAIKHQKRKKQIQKEIDNVVMYLNGALAAGFTIYQSIDMVSKEFAGPIALEFKKIHNDLNYGISLEESFKRFYERMPIFEVKYIWVTLSTLNKEGGDEAKIFNIIEKDFIDMHNRDKEYNTLLAGSALIYKICLLIPFLAIGIELLFNKNYLQFYVLPVGCLFLLSLVLIYIVYILIIKNLMGGSKK